MAHYNYDRLSFQDNSFLIFETPKTPMHVSSTLVYDAGPLRTEEGGIDIERIRQATESYLHRIPRYRQRLRFIPFADHAVWVDDRHFDLHYHVRHTALPKPGTDAQLKRLSSRIMSQPLDRARPLWETWIVEGLENDRFAVITKIHHCMIDGSSGVDIAQIMMSPSPARDLPSVPRYVPRPAPSRFDLVRDELVYRASMPLQAMRGFREFASQTEDVISEISRRARILGDLFDMGLSASDSPINGPLSPHRSFDWLTMPLDDVKAVRRTLECSVNDVVLTVVTGAIREFFLHRGTSPEGLDFRVSAPVSMRSEAERGKLGNRVSSWVLKLPIDEPDPLEQLQQIHETTQELKNSDQALGVEMMMAAAEWTPAGLLSLGAQAAQGPVNSIVTNVPGPQFPLYLQGAKLEAVYPQVPLLSNMGLGIALMSYDGHVCWGFNANPDVVPDLTDFVKGVSRSFEALAKAAAVKIAVDPGETSSDPGETSSDPGETSSARGETRTSPVEKAGGEPSQSGSQGTGRRAGSNEG